MISKTYSFSAESMMTWNRRGSDYYNPKYRNLLIHSVAVFFGVLVGLALGKVARLATLPWWIVVPALTIPYVVYVYAYYRTKLKKNHGSLVFHEMDFVFDYDNNQVQAVSKDKRYITDIFDKEGFAKVYQKKNSFIIMGRPNVEMLMHLERELTKHRFPPMAYFDFVLVLTPERQETITEITHQLCNKAAA